jgi:hypothetical protein
MASFPLLSTSAVTQYPAPLIVAQEAQVIRFLDGSDQRFLTHGRQYRRWQIRLDLLNEDELQRIEGFFDAQKGNYSLFTFPDPFTGAPAVNCRLGNPTLVTEYTGIDAGSTSFWVIETNG